MANSFYDLDYVIEKNEKRNDQLRDVFDKAISKISNIIIIYSIISVFLISICEDFFDGEKSIFHKIFFQNQSNYFFLICLVIFFVLFGISIRWTISFLFPKKLFNLNRPEEYYTDLRLELESDYTASGEVNVTAVDQELKGAYILELEASINHNINLVSSKETAYYRAFTFALFCLIPFLLCLIFHINQGEKPQKVEIVDLKKTSTFMTDTFNVKVNNTLNIHTHDTLKECKVGKCK